MPYHPGPNLRLSYSLEAAQSIEVPDQVLETMRTQLDRRLSARNLLASERENGADQAEIVITGYRMRHGATRSLVGIMAGCDEIQSEVTVRQPGTDETVGSATFGSTECSAVIPAQKTINDHMEKIAEYLTGAD
jgi:hypothetical protein